MASFFSSVNLLFLLLFLFLVLSLSTSSVAQTQKTELKIRRNLVSTEEEEAIQQPHPKKKPNLETKNQTKLIKPKKTNSTTTSSLLPKTHLIKPLNSTPKPSNSTKLKPIKSNSTNPTKSHLNKTVNSTKLLKPIKSNPTKTQLKPLNSTSKLTKKTTPDLTLPKNKTTPNPKPTKPNPKLNWVDNEMDGEDLITEFRDLPSKFHEAFLPDLEKISTTSKAYLTRANKEITKSFKPFLGNKYAPTIASLTSCVFLILPLLLVTLLFHHLRNLLSLQKVLIFIQAYLAIYFAILSLTAVVTGLEPLRFFYTTSPSSYAYTQVLQTLGYVLYLLVHLMNLVVVFSAGESGLGSKALGLAQMIVGLAVGLHYYAAVFHRAVLGEPPKANWKIHGVYATCFIVICAFARAEQRKKGYMQEGGEDGKKS